MIKAIDKMTKVDMKSNIARGLKLSEECGELAEAILSSEGVCGCEYKGKTYEDVLEEAVDVAIMAISVFCGHCPEYNDKEALFKKIMDRKLDKWASKIVKTPVVMCNSDGYCLLDGEECSSTDCHDCAVYEAYKEDN